jgi:ketosteroid isomerase-like protein
MKKPLFFSIFILTSFFSFAQKNKIQKVEHATNKLIQAMISGDSLELASIVADKLSYGHSGGHVEGKKEFIDKIVSGRSDFVTIDIAEQTIEITGNVAVVRHLFNANTNDNGKPGVVKLKVLLVFKKENGNWKLLARQAVKA